MKIVRDISYDGIDLCNLIRIAPDEPFYVDELIAIAEAVGATYIDRITYYRTLKNGQENKTTVETKYYVIEITGRGPKKSYTREQLWEALATYNDA
ncbi:hypothetical protein HYS79_02535 [Patescibacteria group bacterium]|nr:hypothetical protein [Patescibacteria group bacterium]